jgi:hypothetical protein
MEQIVRIELTPVQRECYKNILTRNFEALAGEGGDGRKGEGEGGFGI